MKSQNLILILLFVILGVIVDLEGRVKGQLCILPTLCLCLNSLTTLCVSVGGISISVPKVLDYALNVNNILTLSSLLTVNGDLQCTSIINLLGGSIEIKGKLITSPGCVIKVTGPSYIKTTEGAILNQIGYEFNSPTSSSISKLEWTNNVTMTVASLTTVSGVLPTMIFHNGDTGASGAGIDIGPFNINNPIAMGAIYLDNILKVVLRTGISLTSLIMDSTQTPTAVTTIPIQNFDIFNSTLSGINGFVSSVKINQSTVYLDTPSNINVFNALQSLVHVTSTGSNVSISTLTAVSSPLDILQSCKLTINELFNCQAGSLLEPITGGLASTLLLNSSKVLLSSDSGLLNIKIGVQIQTLTGGIIESLVPTLQLIPQLNPINDLALTSSAYEFQGDLLSLVRGELNVAKSISFINSQASNRILSLQKTLLGLGNTVIDQLDDVIVGTTNLQLDDIVFKLVDRVIPNRLLLSTGSTLSMTTAKLGVDTTTATSSLAQEDALYTLVYSPLMAIMCNNQSFNNATGANQLQFLCDNRMLMLKFNNCSRYTCPLDNTKCVDSPANCPDSNGLCTNSPNTFKCWNGECTTDITNCTALPACQTNQTRCSDGSCVNSTSLCPSCPTCPTTFKYFGCPIGQYECASGECVSNLANCQCNFNCIKLPSQISKIIEIKTPINSTKEFVVPLITQSVDSQDHLDIYGYITFPPDFYQSSIQDVVHLYQPNDLFLDSNNGSLIWGTNRTYRNSARSVIFDVSLKNINRPLFSKKVSFEMNPPPISDLNGLCLSFINETSNMWQCIDQSVSQLNRCGDGLNRICAQTDHFTNFGVLLTYNDDGNGDGSNSEGQSSEEKKNKEWLMKIVMPTAAAAGALTLVLVSGFFLSKIVRHGKVRHWWKTRGGKELNRV